MNHIELGDEVRDTVTGFTGIAIGRTAWLSGCDRVIIQPPVGADGKLNQAESFDVSMCEVVTKGKVPGSRQRLLDETDRLIEEADRLLNDVQQPGGPSIAAEYAAMKRGPSL